MTGAWCSCCACTAKSEHDRPHPTASERAIAAHVARLIKCGEHLCVYSETLAAAVDQCMDGQKTLKAPFDSEITTLVLPISYITLQGQCVVSAPPDLPCAPDRLIAVPPARRTPPQGAPSSITLSLNKGDSPVPGWDDVDYVVTEYGAAPIKRRCPAKRIRNLISIAHPDYRDSLQHYRALLLEK